MKGMAKQRAIPYECADGKLHLFSARPQRTPDNEKALAACLGWHQQQDSAPHMTIAAFGADARSCIKCIERVVHAERIVKSDRTYLVRCACGKNMGLVDDYLAALKLHQVHVRQALASIARP